MFAFSSWFVLVASATAATPDICMDLEIRFQEESRLAAEADQEVRQVEDDIRAHSWMYDNRTDLRRDLQSLAADREALHRILESAGLTPELEEQLMQLAEIESEILHNLSSIEHQIAIMENELVIASRHADIAFKAANRAERRLERCLDDGVVSDRPFWFR